MTCSTGSDLLVQTLVLIADDAPGCDHVVVRVRDRRAPGGWRYYAHLLTHQAGYLAPATHARRAQIPDGRRAGVDANVSNLALASFPDGRPEQLVVDRIACTTEQRKAAEKAARRAACTPARVGSVAPQHQR
jgi:hypothetical protein